MPNTALKLAVALAATTLGSTAGADQALIIANYAYDGATSQRDVRSRAEDVSKTLFGLGYTVNRLENPDADSIAVALDALSAQPDPVVIYYAGRSVVDNGQTRLLTADGASGVVLDDALARAGVGARDATMVFLDVCANPAEVAAPAETDPDAEPVIAAYAGIGPVPATDGLFMASSMPVGVPCTPADLSLTEVMLDRFSIPGLALDALFDGTSVASTSTISTDFVFRPVDTGMRLTADDYRTLDSLSPQAQNQTLARWEAAGIPVDRDGTSPSAPTTQMVTTETVVLTAPVKPVRTGATLTAITPTVSRVQDRISLAPRSAAPIQVSATTSRAVPGAGGLPRPSIIVGLIAPTEASFGTATEPTGPVAGSTIAFTDIDGRRTLRDNDPEFFASLVDAGAFDPPPAELVVALQTELARMNCYNAGIDGSWGPGSRSSVARYYEQLGSASPSQDPDPSIFRQIMLRDDVTCPAVARVAAPPQRSTPQRTSPQRTAQPAPAAPPAAAQAAPSRTINRTRTTGVFR